MKNKNKFIKYFCGHPVQFFSTYFDFNIYPQKAFAFFLHFLLKWKFWTSYMNNISFINSKILCVSFLLTNANFKHYTRHCCPLTDSKFIFSNCSDSYFPEVKKRWTKNISWSSIFEQSPALTKETNNLNTILNFLFY